MKTCPSLWPDYLLKPIELATGRERVQKLEHLRTQKEWFAAMESNIHQNLSRGMLFGPVNSNFGPVATPSIDASSSKNLSSSNSSTSYTFSNDPNDNQENHKNNANCSSPQKTITNAHTHTTPPSLRAVYTSSTYSTCTISFSPTKSERSLTPGRNSNGENQHIRTISSMDETLLVELNIHDSVSCSGQNQLGKMFASNNSSSYALSDTILSKSEEDGNENEEDLESCSILENVIREGNMISLHLDGNKGRSSVFRNVVSINASNRYQIDPAANNHKPAITAAIESESNRQSRFTILQHCNTHESNEGNSNPNLSSCNNGDNSPASRKKGKHIRSNTEGMVYVGNTMSIPDTDTTIKCVCGVYRTHILEQTPPAQSVPVNLDLHTFHDMFSSSSTTNLSPTSFAFLSFIKSPPPPPTLDEIINFFSTIYRQARMESDCIIVSLIYIERLLKHSNGSIRPHATNWKSILLSAMILSSKVSDDLSVWNVHFSQIVPPHSKRTHKPSFTLQRINELERSMLEAVGYHVKVKASEYAKYYFLLRSMLIRSSTFDLEDVKEEDGGEHRDNLRLREVDDGCVGNFQNRKSVLKEGQVLERCSSRYERMITTF